ncbi:hypothetical protein Dxin01_02632 [Deinococcus xinjiangensis]|uniref:YlxR domain-containing protein n=1 Tax=Deinococcus xinjiangensis TaxID=457454 RepID=A0ABP9VEA8_9DEIO
MKHIPERTCVACRRKRPQPDFVRLSKVAGVWTVQVGGRVGRGAYVCADNPACWQEKKLRRAFGAAAQKVAEQLAQPRAAQPQLTPDQPKTIMTT